MELRPYQQSAVDALTEKTRAICVAPAGAGKTIIAAKALGVAVNRLYRRGNTKPSVLWIAHTKEQVQQAIDAMNAVCGNYDGFIKFTACCYASNPASFGVDVLIIDECHHVGAESVKSIVTKAKLAQYIYGFTATPIREDGVDITCIIGPIAYEVARNEIQQVGGVLPAEVRAVAFGATGELTEPADKLAKMYYTPKLKWLDRCTGSDEQFSRCKYRAALDLGIRDNTKRDGFVASLALRHESESVIVLVDSKKQGKRIEAEINMAGGECMFVASGVKGRKQILGSFKRGELKIIVATSLMDEGLDCPVASVLILAGSGKAFGKVIQRTGRVLRPHKDKERGIIYDIIDQGHGMLTAQHWQRRKTYKMTGYRIVKC